MNQEAKRIGMTNTQFLRVYLQKAIIQLQKIWQLTYY